MEKLPISVIALSYNDEKIIGDCLKSVQGWVEDVFVVDSYSTDKTLNIIGRYTDNIHQHHFDNYAVQRNWALNSLPVKTQWVLSLDADQRVTPELKKELFNVFSKGDPAVNGYIAGTKTVFMGRWIRHGGHYPIHRVYLLRKGKAQWEDRKYHQHCIIEGATGRLESDVIDVICSDLTTFVKRINTWSDSEAGEIFSGSDGGKIQARFFGDHIERKRWLRVKLYWRLPLFLRIFLYFFYRYVLLLGFLDGVEGFIFHFTQGLIFNFLVDAKIYEKRRAVKDLNSRKAQG